MKGVYWIRYADKDGLQYFVSGRTLYFSSNVKAEAYLQRCHYVKWPGRHYGTMRQDTWVNKDGTTASIRRRGEQRMIEQYRFDRVYGKVYEYCSDQSAYLYCGIIHPEETESDWILEKALNDEQI